MAIFADSSSTRTLTLGGANTSLILESPTITGSMTLGATTISNKLTFTSANGYILFDHEPSSDTGAYEGTLSIPLLKIDRGGSEKTILERVSQEGGILLGTDDSVIIAAGDTRSTMRTNINESAENVIFASESGFAAYGFPDNMSGGWSARQQFRFYTGGTTIGDNGLYIGSGGDTQFIDLSRNLKNIGTIGSGALTSTGNITGNHIYTNTDSTYSIGTNGVRVANGYFDALHTKGTIQNNTANYINYISNQGHRFYIDGNNDDTTHLFQILSNTDTYDVNNVVASIDQSGDATFAGTVTANGTVLTGDQTLPTDFVSKASGGTFTGPLEIGYQTNTTTTTGTTFLELDNNVGSDISQQQTFIDFKFTDTNANYTPQVRIGAQVGPDADANAISKEGAGSFVVYTAPVGSDESGNSSGLAESMRVSHDGDVTIAGSVTANGTVLTGATSLAGLATESYVNTAVANVVDTAPEALNTLNELAAALGDDANFSTTTATALGNRVRVDTASQGLTSTQKSNARTNIGAGTSSFDGAYSSLSSIPTSFTPSQHTQVISTVTGLQAALDAKLPLAGGTITGDLTVQGINYGLYHADKISSSESGSSENYYHDHYGGVRHLSMFIKNAKADIIRYRAIDNVEYWNGSSWQDGSSQLANVKKLLDGRQDTSWSIPSTYYKFRFTIAPSTSWPTTAKAVSYTHLRAHET